MIWAGSCMQDNLRMDDSLIYVLKNLVKKYSQHFNSITKLVTYLFSKTKKSIPDHWFLICYQTLMSSGPVYIYPLLFYYLL